MDRVMRTVLIFALALMAVACTKSEAGTAKGGASGAVVQTAGNGATSVSAPTAAKKNGPFGLWMGMSKAEVEAVCTVKAVADNKDFYDLKGLPQAASSLKEYSAIIDPKMGIVKILAMSGPIATNSYGESVMSAFNDLEKALNDKYGAGKRIDFLRAGSMWKEDRDWMMGLLKDDRTLMEAWLAKDGAKLPDDTAGIMMSASAVNVATGMIDVQYEGTNFHTWAENSKANENKGL
jgi:hypothetical protein